MTFQDLLIDTLTVTTVSGTDWEGVPLTATVASGVAARVEFKNRQVIDNSGEQTVSNFTAFISDPIGFTVNAGDQLVHDDQNYTVLEIRKMQDDVITHHLELMAQTSRRLG